MSFHSILLTACQTKFLTRPIHAQAFGKRSILEHCGERFESEIEQLNVECISLQGLLERNHVEDLGVIHNDAEEFGCAIQSEPNRDRYSPKAILFETKHMLGKEFSAIKHRLEQTGSLVRTAESDALAVAGSKGLDTHGWSRRERFG